MKSIAFLLLCLHLIGIIAVNNSTITFLNLLEDELIISSESSSLRSGLSLQSSPQGWMSQYLYSGSGCKSASVYMTVGLIINQCLYSPKYKIYFKASCSSSQASLYYYSDSSCKVQTRSAAVYTLNSCGSYSGVSYSYTMQCTTTNTDTLPLPTTKSLVVVSYYQDSSCSTIVQYSGYAESTCMTGSGTSFKYNYPTKTTYSSSSSCSGTGSSATLQTSTCFDWVESYGYSDDTTLSPYSPYMIISQQTVTSTPSLTPSYSPTVSPTVSLAPSNTATPTTTPTIAPSTTPNPSASPSWSFAPSTLKPTPPPRGPTRRPTKAPNNPTTAPTTPLDYTITYQIIQSFANTSCSYFTSSSLRTLELLQDSVSSTLTGKEDNAYISVADVTIIPNTACNISYYLTLSSTLSLGYTSANQAYDTSSWKISSAVSNGDYNSYWSAIAEELKLSSYMDMRTISVEFGSYESNLASSSSGSSSSSTDSVTIIASSVVVSLVFIPLMCCVFIRAYRHCNSTSLKVGIEQDEEIEMVEARYIDDNIMRDETSREERRLPRLPEARPISCIVGEVAHEV